MSKLIKIIKQTMENYNYLFQSAFLASSTYLLISYFPGISILLEHFLTSISLKLYNKTVNEEIIFDLSTNNEIISEKKMIYTEYTIEICISDIESIRQAILGCVTSLEICSDRAQGGITPSIGLVEEAIRLCNGSNIEINVLIRPRPGLFTYTDDEFNVIIRDVIAMVKLGVSGIVCGILTKDGKIDVIRMKILRQLIPNHIKLTFHRAFDICSDSIDNSISDILSIPCNRLLTSGKQKNIEDGLPLVKELISKYANESFEIIVGSGITLLNLSKILTNTGIKRIHIGSSSTILKIDKYNYKNDINSWDIIDNDVIDTMNKYNIVDINIIMNIINITTNYWYNNYNDNITLLSNEDNYDKIDNIELNDPMNESIYLSESYYKVDSNEIS